MKRIFTVLAAAALMAAMMAATAAPAFADRGEKGHLTFTGSGDCETGCNSTQTSSGKTGNATGGPGRQTTNTFVNGSVQRDPNATLFTVNNTSTGGNSFGGGGGKCTSNLTESGTFVGSPDRTSEHGSNPPCLF